MTLNNLIGISLEYQWVCFSSDSIYPALSATYNYSGVLLKNKPLEIPDLVSLEVSLFGVSCFVSLSISLFCSRIYTLETLEGFYRRF